MNKVLLAMEDSEDENISSSHLANEHYDEEYSIPSSKKFLSPNNENLNNQEEVSLKMKEAMEWLSIDAVKKIIEKESTEETFFKVISDLSKRDDENIQQMIGEIFLEWNFFEMTFSHENFILFFQTILNDKNRYIVHDCLGVIKNRKINLPLNLVNQISSLCIEKNFTREGTFLIVEELFYIIKQEKLHIDFKEVYQYLFDINYPEHNYVFKTENRKYFFLMKNILDYIWKKEKCENVDFIFYIFNKYCDLYYQKKKYKYKTDYEMLDVIFSYMKDKKINLPIEKLNEILKKISEIDEYITFNSFLHYFDDMQIIFSKEIINEIILEKKHNTLPSTLDYAFKNNLITIDTIQKLIDYGAHAKFKEGKSWVFCDLLTCFKKHKTDISYIDFKKILFKNIENENHLVIDSILSYQYPDISDEILEAIFKKGLKSENNELLSSFLDYSNQLNQDVDEKKIYLIIETACKNKNEKLLELLLDHQINQEQELQNLIIQFINYSVDIKSLSLLKKCISCADENHISLPKNFLTQLFCKMIPENPKFNLLIQELKNFLYEREIYIPPQEIESKIDSQFWKSIPSFIYEKQKPKFHSASQLNIITSNNLEQIRQKLDEKIDWIGKNDPQNKKEEQNNSDFIENEDLEEVDGVMEEESEIMEEENIKRENINLFVKKKLSSILKPESYLASVLYDYSLNFFTGSDSDHVREKFIRYCQYLDRNNFWGEEINKLFLDEIIENWIANSVGDWSINEQEALMFLLKKLPSSGLKAHTNLFKASCQPGATNRILILFNKIESACEGFFHHETEKNFSKRVYNIYKEKIFQIFDTKLYVVDKLQKKEQPFIIREEINEDEVDDIKADAFAYILSLFPQELGSHLKEDDIENFIMSFISEEDIKSVLEEQ